jgi:outer membrane receptor protein involved in Fe transport
MRKLQLVLSLCLVCWLIFPQLSFGQEPTVVSGVIKNANNNETVSSVSVTIKGGTSGAYTDEKGYFKFTTSQKPPFTLVISSVGYATKEVNFTGSPIETSIQPHYALGEEVVVAASRVPEKIIESPVTIERVGASTIRQAPASNYYDIIGNLNGVDVVASSLTFKSVGTRGFNVNGNLRLNQIVDGMDNQAPGLNFPVGGVIGLTELDVESIELLPGASSALYGPGGMNGTVLINSKDPFKYQGLSFQIKQGVNHVDNYQRNAAPYYDWSLRWAKKVSDKFAFKIATQYVQAQDWLANDKRDYSRTTGTPNGQVIPGTRDSDPAYDGVNVYGDETNLISAGGITFNTLAQQVGQGFIAQGVPSSVINGIVSTIPANQNVSRTGFDEKYVIAPTTYNFKISGQAVYKINSRTDLIAEGNWGTGSTVYTGSDRYALKNLKMGQYKIEMKNKNWFLRAYTTQENAGDSYNSTIAARLFNEALLPSGGATGWFSQYTQNYIKSRLPAALGGAALSDAAAQIYARATTDAASGRPTGAIYNNPLFQKIVQTPISKGGALFVDKTALYMVEGQYNLTHALGLEKTKTDLLVGGNWKQYALNSQGTLFADTAGKIYINEVGAYAQLSQQLFNDVLKLTASGRYDKNSNFDGKFTPRFSAVVKLAKNHNLRFSYQTAYRFPSTQNQWINLLVSGGTRLMGGLPQLRNYYNFNNNPSYTLASVQAFGASLQAGTPNPGLLQVQNFGKFKPESSNSFEVGYKGLIAQKLLIDVYAYWATYQDFLGSVTVVQSQNGSPLGLLGLNPNGTSGNAAATRTIYSISVNTPGNVSTNGWGASVQYLLPRNFSVNANLYSDQIGSLPSGFVSYFNTPKIRTNIGFSNSGFLLNNRLGFSLMYRYQDSFYYEGTFGTGTVPSFSTIDGVITFKLPATKSMIKIGGTNLLNHYYTNGFGNAQIGGLYYISYGYNVF